MSGFLREHSWPIVFSVGLHGLLAAALLAAALLSINSSLPKVQPIPIDAVVIDSQVLHAAQRELAQRADQEAARARAAAEAKAAEEASAAQAAADAQKAAEQQRADEQAKAAAAQVERTKQAEAARESEAQKVAAAKRAEELKRAEGAKRADDARRTEEAKRAAEAKQAEDAKHAVDLKAKAEREAELRRQLAEEEHVSAVEASPAKAQYLARLSSRIQNAWIKPPSARAGLDCIVNITQIPGGEVTSAHVSQCNGDAAARQSIENAVYRASPLPAPPDPALFEHNLVIHFHPEE
jgi:colicin import membrane protein